MEPLTPQISNSGYASNAINVMEAGWMGGHGPSGTACDDGSMRRLVAHAHPSEILFPQSIPQITSIMPQNTRRIVQVFIADPNENVPLDQSLIYQGEQKLTDATDQELFFEINLAPKLEEYNKKRVTFTDKEASKRSGKDIFLEPVRIRDLRMVVTDIAKF